MKKKYIIMFSGRKTADTQNTFLTIDLSEVVEDLD